jgi:signal transduction histidine kinase
MYQKSLNYFKKAIELGIETKNTDNIALTYVSAVFELVPLKRWDEAKLFLDKSKSFTDRIKDKRMRALADARQGDAAGQILMGQGKYQEALQEFLQVNKIAKNWNMESVFSIYMNSYIAQCYQGLGNLKKSLAFAEKSYPQVLSSGDIRLQINASLLLSNVHEDSGNFKQAYEYLKKYRDILKEKEEQDIDNLTTNLAIENLVQKNEQQKAALEKEKIIKEQENKNQRWWLFSIAAALFSSFVFLYFLYRNNQNKQKANNLLSRQKEEINLQRDKAEKALSQLKSTQAQLIQKEKLASLGELTAGIAHEIQNPLNFVNNFSEMSVELANELKEEAQKPEIDKELIIDLASDLSANQEKINHHGKRASSIVKGMLEHSRSSTGVKELTDINKLADEYLRLAYHGIRAKDNNFNSDYKTDFDENLPKIEVIPQDIGRVLLNLINNAFWAVKTVEKPLVVVKTEQADNQIIIKIKDNGAGMSEATKAKIFQPFFTTKPTGEGTGLGLSLAYDIVTKGHGGTIECESVEGEGTTFIVTLPL